MVKRMASLALIVALGVAVAAAAAPEPFGKIAGTVRDEQGQPLPNAKLQLRNVDTGQIASRARPLRPPRLPRQLLPRQAIRATPLSASRP